MPAGRALTLYLSQTIIVVRRCAVVKGFDGAMATLDLLGGFRFSNPALAQTL